MELNKGKIYYNTHNKSLFICEADYNSQCNWLTDKIAVHTPNQEDWDYVTEKMGYDWGTGFENEDRVIYIDSQEWDYKYNFDENYSNKYHLITIEQFRELYKKDEMKTKVTILGQQEPNVKKIEFVKLLKDDLEIKPTTQKPSDCKEVILLQRDYGRGLDLMFGIFEEQDTNCIFLGHFNSGTV